MSATTSSPTASQAGGSTCPRFGAAKVTVDVAPATAQSRAPVSDGTPDGRSTATTGTPASRRARIASMASAARPFGAARRPVPSTASTTRSAASIRARAPFQASAASDLGDAAGSGPLALLQVMPRVARDVVAAPEQERLGPRGEPARDDEAVAAVHPAAAKHDDPARPGMALGHHARDGGAGVLHQDRARDAGLRDRMAVGAPHLLGRQDGNHLRNLTDGRVSGEAARARRAPRKRIGRSRTARTCACARTPAARGSQAGRRRRPRPCRSSPGPCRRRFSRARAP